MCEPNVAQKILDELQSIRRHLESYENNSHNIDQYYQISYNSPLILDYKGRRYLYAWTATSITCTATIGTIDLTTKVWNNISLGEGSQLIPPVTTTTQLLVRATNEKIV